MLHFIRHAHSKFNKVSQRCLEKYGNNYYDTEEYLTAKFCPSYFDVQITEEGIQQAEKARELVKDLQVDIVLVSPMRRALHTCSILFQNHPSKPVIIVQPVFREIMQSANDIGSKLIQSMAFYPSFNYDKITDKQAWFVSTLSNQRDRTQILNKLEGLSGAERTKVAIQECMKLMKQNWFQRRKQLHNQEKFKERILPDYNEQKQVLNYYAQKHKNIVVVGHSQTIKRYAGYKINNCEIYSMFYDRLK